MSSAREFLLSVLPSQTGDKTDGDGKSVPSVTLTFAQSLDGKIAGTAGRQLILSGSESMLMTHWMRSMHDAILVGIGTTLNDDPQLNVRLIPEASRLNVKLPRPVILDAYLRLPMDCKLLKNYSDGKGQQPWVFCASQFDSDTESARAERTVRKSILETAGAVIYEIPCVNGLLSIPHLLRKLYERDVHSVMVEGGATVIGAFLNQASQPCNPATSPVVDTLIVTVAPTLVGDGGVGYKVGFSGEQLNGFTHVRTDLMGKDTVIAGKFI
ncbi:dihydrofolate reductase-like domain-containing protein [Melanogaster broomeanus]|nr:dihydrofolate reductase-like domain-containing protein [Melanogaster broomeanus]